MCLGTRDKNKMYAIPPGYLVLFSILYQILLVLGDSIMLGKFKLGDEVLDISIVYPVILLCSSDADFFLGDSHEC